MCITTTLFYLLLQQHKKILFSFAFFSLFISSPALTQSQVNSDGSLQTNVNNLGNGLYSITGGTRPNNANNLFHSLGKFSVGTRNTVRFVHQPGIQNIITRITGGSPSYIDGKIQTLIDGSRTQVSSANLFLINPQGIIFGPNATLDIGGSLIGSTADSIKFADGIIFSASKPNPILSIDVPIGLQYGAQPGNIIVEGTGNRTGFTDPSINDYSLRKKFRPPGLKVSEGKTLALIGGNIALDGGNLTAAQGHIELSSVREGLVGLDVDNGILKFDYQGVAGFQDIALVNAASVEVSGNSSGTVNVRGQNISLTDASAIFSNTSGNGTGGSITLNGADSVTITGISQNQIPFVSYVSTDTTAGSTGPGADLTIDTNYLLVARGAQVGNAVFGSGKGGNLSVNAGRIELISGSPVAGSSGLFAPIVPGANGDGGNINVEADSLLLAGGAQAFTLSVSSGKAGDFNIKAQDIELNGTSPNGAPSGLFSNALAGGDGGNLTINTGNLVVADGADIGSTVNGLGMGGNIDIKANTIELTSLDSLKDPSQISASVQTRGTGVGGDITIDTNSLKLSDGTQINSSVFAAGEAGNVAIKASEINLTGYSSIAGRSTGLFATVFSGATGNSGNVTISTETLQVSDGAQIAVSTAGSGLAGNLTLTASNSVELIGNAIQFGGGSSGLFANAVLSDGQGGHLTIITDQLTIRDGATINVSNFLSSDPENLGGLAGTGPAGNIEVNSASILLDNQSTITANSNAGNEGNIFIDGDLLLMRRGSNITVNALGTANGGNITINSPVIVGFENSNIIANAITGDGGDINITTQGIFGLEFRDRLTLENDITASSEFGVNGTVDINTFGIDPSSGLVALPEVLADSSQQITTGCSSVVGGNFVITGRGGVPQKPDDLFNGKTVYTELFDLVISNLETSSSISSNRDVNVIFDKQKNQIIEAQRLIVNLNGEVELVAAIPNATVQTPWEMPSTCGS